MYKCLFVSLLLILIFRFIRLLFHSSRPNGCELIPCGFDLHFPNYRCERLLMCLSSIRLFSLEKCLFESFVIFESVRLFVAVEFRTLRILNIEPLTDVRSATISSVLCVVFLPCR